MAYPRSSEDGYEIAQHHARAPSGGTRSDPSWPEDRRLVTQCVRVFGRDPDTFDLLVADGPGGNCPEIPNTIGYEIDRAVWFASEEADPSGTNRTRPIWGNAFPAVAVGSGTTTSDPYGSKVQSDVFVLPAFDQDPKDPGSWRPDTGVLPQKVAVAGGRSVAGGTQLVVLPFSIQTEQQMAAFKAGGEIVAVWRGGAPQGHLGTLVYDVDAKGDLDEKRRARVHTAWRVYREPRGGLLPFGADPGAEDPPFPVSSGLAWQLGLDVDSRAGYGMVVDQVAGSAAPAPATKPDPVSAAEATGSTREKRGSGAGSGTVAGGGAAAGAVTSVFGVTSRRGFGGHSVGQLVDKHRIATTPDGEPVNCDHWNVLQPIDGDGFDAPAATSGVWEKPNAGGPLIVEVFWRYDKDSEHKFLGGTRPGLRRWQARVPMDVVPPPRDKFGLDKAGGHDKVAGFDKFGGVDKAGGTDKAAGSDEGKPPNEDKNPFEGGKIPDDAKGFSDLGGGKLPDPAFKAISDTGARGGFVEVPPIGGGGSSPPTDADYKALIDGTTVPDPPEDRDYKATVDPIRETGARGGIAKLPFTFGGGILLGGGSPVVDGRVDPGLEGTITKERRYARSPLEVAVPGLIGRQVPIHGADLRGRVDGFTEEQREAYDEPTPITGQIAAVGAQSTGGYEFFQGAKPGAGLFAEGSALRGGFALLPSNCDVREMQRGVDPPSDRPETFLFAATTSSKIAWSDFDHDIHPVDGYVSQRDSTDEWSLRWFDSSGRDGGSTELDPALAFDASPAATPSASTWGGQIVRTYYPSTGVAPNGYVFRSDGTNGVPGGSWVDPSAFGVGVGPALFGTGQDGTYTLDGSAAGSGMTFDGSLTYTLSRDVFAGNLTMSGAYRLNTAGWRLYVNGTLTLGASNRIANDGNAAVTSSPGGATTSQTVGYGTGGGGAVSRSTAGSTAGNAGTSQGNSFGASGGRGGDDSPFTAGGAGGVATAPATNRGELWTAPQAAISRLMSYAGDVNLEGGAGGGSGFVSYNASDTGTHTSGAGGGGAGIVLIAARKIVNAGLITANGGPGGAATTTGTFNGGGAGGGGGGGGGLAIVIYGSNGSTIGTVQANGGLGGTSLGLFTNAAQAGSTGRTRLIPV